jgi:hypothetical protein
MTKEPVSLATFLHIYPVSCFFGDVPLIGYAKLFCYFSTSSSISEYLGVIWLSEVALGMVLMASRTGRRTCGGRHLGKHIYDFYEHSLCICARMKPGVMDVHGFTRYCCVGTRAARQRNDKDSIFSYPSEHQLCMFEVVFGATVV